MNPARNQLYARQHRVAAGLLTRPEIGRASLYCTTGDVLSVQVSRFGATLDEQRAAFDAVVELAGAIVEADGIYTYRTAANGTYDGVGVFLYAPGLPPAVAPSSDRPALRVL